MPMQRSARKINTLTLRSTPSVRTVQVLSGLELAEPAVPAPVDERGYWLAGFAAEARWDERARQPADEEQRNHGFDEAF